MQFALPPFGPNFIMYCLGLSTYFEPSHQIKSSNDKLTITAVVPAYNEEESIAGTLESLQRQTAGLEKIIVVDDGSTDSTSRVVRRFRNVTLFRNRQQMGKAESINQVLHLINTDLVIIVDADTILEECYVEKTLEAFGEERVVAASGFIVPDTKSSNAAIRSSRVVEDFYSQTTLKRGQNMINALFVIPGCCSIFRTSVLKRVGFSAQTVTEDLDLTWHLEQEGFKTSLVKAVASTREPSGLKQYVSQIRRWYTGFFQCLSKHGFSVFSNKSLTFTLTLILIESLIFTLFWASVIGLVFVSPWLTGEAEVLRWIILTLLAVDIGIVCFPAALKAKSMGRFKAFLVGLPVYYSLRVVNTFVWWGTFADWLFGYTEGWKKPP